MATLMGPFQQWTDDEAAEFWLVNNIAENPVS
jgi:hypothetical protein